MKEKLPVIFRAERRKPYEVTAVFPTLPASSAYDMTCYVRVGQHGSCNQPWYNGTRAAKPAEYNGLLAELADIYDDCELVVYQKITPQHRKAHAAKWRRFTALDSSQDYETFTQ